ncbi:MAG: hypothetical protein JJE47_00095 [Acidimicrobiia bacterium]|nr:hypothetical protein [Acidimicrobiia bacterium]
MNPGETLNDIARDEWADPVAAATKAAKALLELTETSWAEVGVTAAQALRKRRSDQALLLAVTEAAMDLNPGRSGVALLAIIGRLEDPRWSMDLAYEAARFPSLGVLSLGSGTLAVLQAVTEAASPELRTSSRAFRRGLLEYAAPVSLVPAETADCVLLPVAARHNQRLWTTAACARAARAALTAGRAILPVAHPVSELSPLSRQVFRPAAHIIDLVIQPAG